jgi:protein subunit release factor A
MKSKEEAIAELTEQGARIVFAQHILSGNRDERVRDYFNEERYKNVKLGLECANLELVNQNKELLNKINLLTMCRAISDARIKGLDKELASYKEKYEIALKAIEELEKTIDKGHYVNRCCK